MTEPFGTDELTPEAVASFSGGLVPAATPGLSEMISSAIESIRHLCGWHIFPVVEETITVDARGGTLLHLPTLRVLDLLALKVNGVPVDLDYVDWSASGMLALRQGHFPDRFRSVEVTIRHGYDSVPDLLRVVAEIVKRGALAGVGSNISVGAISVGAPVGSGAGGGSVMPVSTEWRIIDLYRLRS